jgi:predicted nucleic acid-binding protein
VRALWRAGDFLFTTRVNVAEILVGAFRAADPGLERSRIRRLLQPIAILELDEKAGERFGLLKANALQRGRPVGDADLFIAAIAQINNCSLLTRNPRHFRDVSGLRIENY